MRNAFALLGVGFMVILGATYILFSTPAEAPEKEKPDNTDIHATSSIVVEIENDKSTLPVLPANN